MPHMMENHFFWPIIGLLVVLMLRRASGSSLKNVPTVKYHRFLPNVVNRILYYPKATSMISQGYYKVCWEVS